MGWAWEFSAAAAALVLLIRPAAAQEDPDAVRRLERQLREIDTSFRLVVPQDQPISERLLLDYGGSIRFGFYAIDDASGGTRILRQTDGVLQLQAELDGAHRFFGRLRFLYDDFDNNDSFDGEGDELDEPIADRYWYQFDLRGARRATSGEHIDYNLNLKVGRQFVPWGSGLALSDTLYAAQVDIEFKRFGLTGLIGLTPSTGTIDFDGSRPGFDSDTDRAFYGARLEYRGFATHRPYVFLLVQRDHNERDFRNFPTIIGTIPTSFHYDSEYLGLGSRGTLGAHFAYRAEVIHESGEGLSDPINRVTGLAQSQRFEDIDAWAGLLGVSYVFLDPAETRIDFEFIGGSGDDDRLDSANTFGGNRRGTSDNAFNSLGFVNTGLALAPDVSNLLSFHLGASTNPLHKVSGIDWLRVGIDGFIFSKVDKNAPLNIATTNDGFVGGEVDLFLDWRITSDVFANFRYGVFIPGDAIPPDQNDPRHFFYAGVTYAF